MGGLYYICGLSVNHWCDKSFLIKDYYYLFIKPYFTHHIFLACPLQPLSKGSLLPFPRSLSRLVFLSLHIPPSLLPYFIKKWAASNLQNYIAYSHNQGRAAKILTSTFTCDVIRQWSCFPSACAVILNILCCSVDSQPRDICSQKKSRHLQLLQKYFCFTERFNFDKLKN